MASVAMKDGIFRRTCASPDSRPASTPMPIASTKAAIAEPGNGQGDDHAGQRRHRLDREIDAAQHDDEGDAGRQDEQHGGVAGELQQGGGLQEDRLHGADQHDQDDQRGQRQPLARAGPLQTCIDKPAHTICPIRSTCRGLCPGLAAVRWVISPSRITSTVWLRPIVSSSVSEVSTTATPSAVTARTRS